MKYIKEEQFIASNGKAFRMENAKGQEGVISEKATVSEMLHWLLSSYTPQLAQVVNQGPLLTPALRCLNRCLDILDCDPQEEGRYRFEDADFKVLEQVVSVTAPLLVSRNAPLLEDLVSDAATSLVGVADRKVRNIGKTKKEKVNG